MTCPCCGARYRRFLPFGRPARANARCASCDALDRHRLIYLYLKKETRIFTDPASVLHFAPERQIEKLLARLPHLRYIRADLDRRSVDVRLDIQRLPLRDGAFDFILCIHVLEHIPDDFAAMREMLRVCRPGGRAIINVPLRGDSGPTVEHPSLADPAERRRLFGQEDHVRFYGIDIERRLRAVGFEVRTLRYAQALKPTDVERYGLPQNEVIFDCKRSAAAQEAHGRG